MNLIMSQYSTTLEDDAMRNIIVLIFFFLSFFLTESVLQKLRSIVAMNENLKRQEQEFRAHCKVFKPSKGFFLSYLHWQLMFEYIGLAVV